MDSRGLPREEKPHMTDSVDVAILLPCHNEEAAIASVVRNFREHLPGARIYVYDNNSTDGTADAARAQGAIVRREPRQGKGHVVRRMFADVEADVYVLADGDGTYDPASAAALIDALVENRCDMVNAARVDSERQAYRPGHRIGNRILTGLVGRIFGNDFADILSGYRVFSRRFVKSFPGLSTGFEIETELTVHALSLDMPLMEIPTAYAARAEGSQSKLHTVRDGLRILRTIVTLAKEERPLYTFSIVFVVLAIVSVLLSLPVFAEWLRTGLVPRFPTAILSASMMLLAFISLTNGFVLSSVTRGRREAKRLQYLALPWLKPGTRDAETA
jgi:glycosyltransferase involved in cell wall biosynthesis